MNLFRKATDAFKSLIGSYRFFRSSTNPTHTRWTREGLQFCFMIAFVLLGAALRNANLLVFLAGTLIGMVWIHWRICTRTLHGLVVDRRFPRSIQARKPFEIELRLRNPKSWLGAWLVLVQDRLVSAPLQATTQAASQAIQLLYLSVPPKSVRSQRYLCTADRRGRYQWVGIEITTRFPLGLMRGILPQKDPVFMVVHPALGKLNPNWKELFQRRKSGSKQRQIRALSDEGEFFGLRDYRHGDSKRWIHWRSSARRDELVVKQFQQPDNQEMVILLDLYRSPNSVGDETEEAAKKAYDAIEDRAVEFVSTLAHQITTNNAGSVTVAISDANPTVASRIAAKSQAYFLQERLAIARSGTPSSLGETLRLLEKEYRAIDQLLVISTRAMPENWSEVPDIQESPERREATGHRDGIFYPFWRSIRWIDVEHDDAKRYFTPAPAE